MVTISRVEATYTGGSIYVYTGQLSDGDYFMTVDDWEDIVMILDVDPFEHWEENGFEDWQNAHTLYILTAADAFNFWKAMLEKVEMLEEDKALRISQLIEEYPMYA